MRDSWVDSMRAGLGARLTPGWRDEIPWGYPQQMELALIAGVYAAQISPAGVGQVVDSYLMARPGKLLDDVSEIASRSVGDLIAAIGERWGDTTVLGVPVLRTQVIHDAAEALVGIGVRSADDFRSAMVNDPFAVTRPMLAIRGLGPGTWEAIGLMAHAELPPTDAEVAFVRELAGDDEIPADEVSELLRLTARRFAVDKRGLMYAVARALDAPQ